MQPKPGQAASPRSPAAADKTDQGERHSAGGGVRMLALLTAVVCAAVLAAHWPALSAQALAFDDNIYLTENRLVQNPSWANARRFLTEVLEPSTVGGYYQPLTMISLMLDSAAGGSPDNLGPFHRTSLALHVVNTALLIVLIYLLFRQVWPAAMVGLLFGVHPLTVEPVPWVGERKTLLAALFVLLSLIAYVRYARRVRPLAYGACAAAYVLALLTKPTATALPVLLLLLDYWPFKRLNKRAVVEKVPLLIVGLASAVVTYVSQSRTAITALPGEYSPVRIPLTICHNIIFYLYKMVWPANLTAHYPFPEPFSLAHPMVLIGVVGTVVLLAGLGWSLRHTRALAVGWLFFFVAIFPTLGVIGFTNVVASDKFVYLPAVGLLITLAWLIGRVWKAAGGLHKPAVIRGAMVGLVVVLAVAEGVATRRYLVHWKDTESFGRRIVALAPRSYEARIHYAGILTKGGKVGQAIEEFNRALEIEPRYWKTHYNLAVVLTEQGHIDEAYDHYEQALRYNQDQAEAYNNAGAILIQRGRLDEAAVHFARALELEPDYAEAHNNLGVILLQQKRIDEAVEHFNRALQTEPDNHKAHTNLGRALVRKGRIEEAVRHFERAVQIDDKYPDAHVRWGEALFKQEEVDAAIEHYRQAIRIDPDHAAAHIRLAAAFSKKGRHAEAAEQYREAIRINPEHASVHHDLGVVRMRQGLLEDAALHFANAVRLDPTFGRGYINLGLALMRLGRPREAIQAYQQAVEVAPESVSAHINLGNALRQLGKFDEAVRACRRAIQLDPDNAGAHFTLGLSLEQMGNLAEAIIAYRQTMRLNPEHAQAWQRLTDALDKQARN